jgi:glycine dehydrogenase subunit 1
MRYLPLTDQDRRDMLDAVGANAIEDLFSDVPPGALLSMPVNLPRHQGELEVERRLTNMAAMSVCAADAPFFLGAGAYRHHIPASVDHLIQRSEFLTSYTPYQPEISQGTLQYLFEFQTQVAMITGMEVANASMYDGSTACSEAVLMACRITKRKKAVLSGGLHPQYSDVVQTVARFAGNEVVRKAPAPEGQENLLDLIDDDTACVVVQTPSFFGNLHDLSGLAEAAHSKGALLVVVVTEIVALGALKAPGEMGADIVVAEGQSLGNGLNFGGPYVGLFATRKKFLRQMPGRLCGKTLDEDGNDGFVLTLSTREQHIRREKATSNICTNSGLCCLAFAIHLALLGEEGFRKLAAINHERAVKLAELATSIEDVELVTPTFFNEFTLRLPKPAHQIVEALAAQNILAGVPASRLSPDDSSVSDLLIVAVTEMTTPADCEAFCDALSKELVR